MTGKRRNTGILLILLALFVLAGCTDKPAAGQGKNAGAEQGFMDLSSRPLNGNENIKLEGEWEFYWKQLLVPSDFTSPASVGGQSFIRVPAFWHDEAAAESDTGHATYRLVVRLNEADAGKPLALYMPYGIESAYRLWVNGDLLASAGEPGTSGSEMKGKYKPQVVAFSGHTDNEIIVQVSNYVQRTGGMWDEIRLGHAGSVSSFYTSRLAAELFVAGGIIIMGLYHLGLFGLRRKDRTTLYFGILCLLIGGRSLFMGEVYVNRLIPGLSFDWYKRSEYLGQYLAPAFFLLYVRGLFPKDIHNIMVRVLVVFDTLLSVLVLVLPATLFTYTLPVSQASLLVYAPYVVYVFVAAAVRKREGALFCCILFIVMALTVVNDVLYYNNVIVTIDMAKFGMFVFIFAQAFLLSIKFSKAFRSVEELSERQARWSHELEQTVNDRTQELSGTLDELKSAQKQLVESEKMAALGALVAGIAHEINTPVGISVTAASHLEHRTRDFGDVFRGGKMKRSDLEGYLQLVGESAHIVSANLARTADLIRGFKQVAVDQSSEILRPFAVKEYIREVLFSLGPQIRKSAIHIQVTGPDGLELSSYPGAISQIVTNLVMNSIVHAYGPEDKGEIAVDVTRSEDGIVLKYSDDGKGMTPEVKERVFDPFFTTNRAGGGTGLGMHIIYNLVTQSLGGTIECESEPGRGTGFTITIPSREIA